MTWHAKALLFALAASSVAAQRPTISHITEPEAMANVGGTAEMACTVQNAREYPVVWVKLDTADRSKDLVIATFTSIKVRDPRYHVEYSSRSSSYTLRITEVQETDGAIYQCQVVISPTDTVKANVPLIVRTLPVITDDSTRSIVAAEGERAELKCYASGNPEPNIYWRRQDKALLPTNAVYAKGNTLVFEHIRKEDRGTYFCIASNVVGNGTYHAIDVEVELAPTIKLPPRKRLEAITLDMDLDIEEASLPKTATTAEKLDTDYPCKADDSIGEGETSPPWCSKP